MAKKVLGVTQRTKKKRWELCGIPDCKDKECCSGRKCTGYRGTKAKTVTGKTCQAWNKQSPHKHKNTPALKPFSGLAKNYCRNPDGAPTAWCYTTDKKKRFEMCGIPKCQVHPCDNGRKGGCSHFCIKKGKGRVCKCKKGFKLWRGIHCKRIHRCDIKNGGCR